jgi:hypothetical protein
MNSDLDLLTLPEAATLLKVSVVPERSTIHPLTDQEVQVGLAALKESAALIERLRERRRGKPLAPSWPMLRQEREERSQRL